jgi:putative ABC transport system permease protein
MWRGLLKDRRFTFVAVVTVALGVGATTAVFAVVDTVLLRPFPFADADRIVSIAAVNTAKGQTTTVSPRDLEDLSHASRTVARFGAWRDWHFVMRQQGEVVRASSAIATPELFGVFGATAAAGRLLEPSDNQPGHDHVVVLANRFWRRQFGGDASIVGQTIDLDREPYVVVGVLPESFSVPSFERFDIWAPVSNDPDQHKGRWLRNRMVFARLAPDASLGAARAELDTLARQLAMQYPDSNGGWGVRVSSLIEAEVGDVRPALLVMLAAVALVLLIASANLAGLQLARAAEHRGERAVRAALGATPGDLARMLVAESLTLTMAGAALGVVFSVWLLRLFDVFGPALPRAGALRFDWRIALFAIAIAAATALGAAVVPALRAGRVNLIDAMRGAGRDASGDTRSLRAQFVAIELALALMLLVGAGLLVRSFAGLMSIDPGFRTSRVLTVDVFPGLERYPTAAQVAALYQRIQQDVATIPGVVDVSAVSAGPLFGGRETTDIQPRDASGATPSAARYFNALPGYFKAMGVPLVDGRDFTDADAAASPPVAIVNETLARRFWPGRQAVGHQLTHVRSGNTIEVVGVVADAMKDVPPRSSEPEVYWPYLQQPRWAAIFVIHTAGPAADAFAAMRARVRLIDAEVVLGTPRTIEERMEGRIKGPRFQALLLSIFALIAVALTSIGVYGMTAYAVEQRVHEIGVRLSLGADRGDIVRLIVGQAGRATAVGAVAGSGGAVLLSRFLRTLLFGVAPTDPTTLVGAAALLVVLALLAAWVPARRAARLDPLTALRAD